MKRFSSEASAGVRVRSSKLGGNRRDLCYQPIHFQTMPTTPIAPRPLVALDLPPDLDGRQA